MSSPEPRLRIGRRVGGLLVLAAALSVGLVLRAHAALPAWLQHIVGASSVESALYRVMPLPLAQVLYPRPPREAQGELAKLIAAAPADAELYALRARSDESALDFNAAEADWRQYVAHAGDGIAARLALADFYHRQLRAPEELKVLRELAAAPALEQERFANPATQRSWRAYERIFLLIHDQALPESETQTAYEAFLARYPEQPVVYARAFQFLLGTRHDAAAEALIPRFRKQFPQDAAFPVRAQALLAYRRGDVDKALAVYDQAFQPLWPADLVASYFALLNETHRQRAFVAAARERLRQQPDGPAALNALARIFYYEQQGGHLDRAQQAIDAFRIAREQRNGSWSAEDLYTLATLTNSTHSYAETARYNYALASSAGALSSGEPAAQAGLAGLVDVLLSAPEQAIALGAGNLTLYRDIATLDQGPGYWNGILSLWLNGTSPAAEYNSETAKAQSYFHRAKAAELLAELDRRFPAAPERSGLHVQMLHAYAEYGEPAAVIRGSKQYLTDFPGSSQRLEVANLMADAYARQGDSPGELGLYDATLAELQGKLQKSTGGMPLSAAPPAAKTATDTAAAVSDGAAAAEGRPGEAAERSSSVPAGAPQFSLGGYAPYAPVNADAADYAALLDRYLGRLVALQQMPRALAVLRRQLDLNPNDPLVYEKLAGFLEQNNLSGQQEQVYRAAVAHFQQTSGVAGMYDKLARLYLRQRNHDAYAALTKEVTDIFSGTELDAWFARVGTLQQLNPEGNTALGPRLALQLNLYAEKRFPHDLVFTRNLLNAYSAKPTADRAALEALLRRHWWQEEQLRDQFFDLLASSGKLQAELAQLQPLNASTDGSANPAAVRELAEAAIWSSHFEQAAPLLGQVADLYPADSDVGDRAVSLFRSLSYLDTTPAALTRAVAIETHLAAADPRDADRLATLGDLYAEATATGGEDLRTAAPYWRRIPAIMPGVSDGYLTTATIFWDYFQFDEALAQVRLARERFHSATLYGYETGAIQENRGDLSAAVVEYAAAAGDSGGGGEARSRLLQLAQRPATRGAVDGATVRLLAQQPQNSALLALRADVLVAQHREAELAALFDAALAKAATADEAEAVATQAQARALTPVYERSLARQAELTADPVRKIELNYSLAASLESRKQAAAASRIMEATYRANPKILGVVRATTDFYARNGQPAPAIATLLDAAKVATPELSRSFTLEAAQKANDAGDTAQARRLALALLPAKPYDAQVLATIAASYARAHDDAGLKVFYEGELAGVKAAQITPAERKADVALLRRGLIPALTRLKDYAGALDQYIALLSAYPEDTATAQEAARYSLRYDRKPQLAGFLQTTVQQSAKDARFAVLLAQVDTIFEDLPGALAAYNAAITIRKDRVDLYEARADLELRLGLAEPAQLEAAAADFNRLYLLTYKDPAWMVRLAELRARQQRPADAVGALTTAYLSGHPAPTANYFRVASQLAEWNLLTEARGFAQQGVARSGRELLLPKAGESSGAATYAHILTRLGKAGEALATLAAARRNVETGVVYPEDLAAKLEEQGVDAKDQAAQRAAYLGQRRQTADTELQRAIAAMGEAVQAYDTPEQKLQFAELLDRMHRSVVPGTSPALALAAATAAGLADREAEWRRQLLLRAPLREAAAQREPFATLQRSRLQDADLAQTLATFAGRQRDRKAAAVTLQQAAQAWRDSGDETAELRLTRTLATRDAALRDRFFDLLLRHDRSALAALAAAENASLADAAVNYTVAHADQSVALAAVAARGRALPAVWRPAISSLVLTYFADARSPVAPADFNQALSFDASIAERLGAPLDPAQHLTGDNWFYYASRFGIYLASVARAPALPEPEDFLPAELEQSPTAAEGYVHLAQTYAEANVLVAAGVEFNHALELEPNDLTVRDRFATTLYPVHGAVAAQQREAAVAQWRAALEILRRMQERNNFPESFFSGFEIVLKNLGVRGLGAQFRPEIEGILRPYFARNGNYRSNELLEAAYSSAANPQQGIALVISVANAAADPNMLLGDLRRAKWLDPSAREPILLREIEIAREHATNAAEGTATSLPGYQSELISFYLDRNEIAKAQAVFESMPAAHAGSGEDADRLILATRGNHLQPLLDGWRADPETLPGDSSFSAALSALRRPTAEYKPDPAQIRPLQEFYFEHKQLSDTLVATDYLALAQVRLDTNDLAGALEVLHRLALRPASADEKNTLVPDGDVGTSLSAAAYASAPNAWTNIDSAASLLETTGHPAEAIPFLTSLVASVPWNATYRVRLAEAQLQSQRKDASAAQGPDAQLIALIRDASAPYAVRVRAARDLKSARAGGGNAQAMSLGSAELDLLASDHPSVQAARHPYFSEGRLVVAADAGTPRSDRIALLREAIAIVPGAAASARARLDLLLLEAGSASPAAVLALYSSIEQTAKSGAAESSASATADADADGGPADETSAGDAEAGRTPADVTAADTASLPSVADALDLPARTRLVQQLASAFRRTGESATALAYLDLAITLNSDPAHHAQAPPSLLQERDAFAAALERERENATRRPVIHKELAQPGQVRPRLAVAEAEAP